MATSQDPSASLGTRLPILSLATPGTRLIGLGTVARAAEMAGLRWLDLDLAGRPRRSGAVSIARAIGAAQVGIRAIWLPPPSHAWLDRSARLADLAGELVAVTGARAIVVDRPRHESPRGGQQAELVQQIRANAPPTARLTFAVRPDELEGTREHLRGLTALRLSAEEWDVDLALDLRGPIDPTWESEAAVSKLMPRLTIVRIGPLESRPPGRGRARQTARVLSFLADLGYRGTIAITAEAPFWRPDRAILLARSCQQAAETVQGRYNVVRQELWLDASMRRRERL